MAFRESATIDEIKSHSYALTLGRYVDAAEIEDNGIPFEEKVPALIAELEAQFSESARLEKVIRKNLGALFSMVNLEC